MFCGGGSAGSWIVRGQQLGTALGATVEAHPTLAQCKAQDLIVLVKKARPETLEAVAKSGRPVVYDLVDCYPQPLCSDWTQAVAVGWVRKRIAQIAPCAVVWPNRRMGEDVGFDGPSMVLRHHARPGMHLNPIRDRVRTVGYEGAMHYLGRWHRILSEECGKRGWQFHVNPDRLTDLDIAVAFRDGEWNGYCQQNWKSAVKLENCFSSGTPFIGAPEEGYREVARTGHIFADTARALTLGLDWLAWHDNRIKVAEQLRACAYTLDQAAADYGKFLDAL